MPSQKRTNATPPPCDDATWALMHALPDAAILIDTDGIICAVNEAAAKNLKTTTADLAGTSLYDASPPDTVSEQKRRIDEVIRSGKPLRTEGVREGKRIDHSIYPIFDDGGTKVTRLVVVTRDITEYRRVKEERQRLLKQVKEQARTFNGILSSSDDRIYVFGRDMRYTYVNLPGARAFGMAPKDIVGKTWKELGLPLEPMRRVIALGDMVFATGRPQTEELQWNGADGEMLFYECIHTPIFNARGEVESIVSTFRNITERKRAEENVERAAKFPEENPNPVLRLSAEGEILYANKPGQKLLDDWDGTAGGTAPQPLRDATIEALSRQVHETIEVEVNSRIFEFFVISVTDAGYVNIYGQDVTERKRVEEAVAKSEEKYRELVERSNSIILKMDIDGIITFINEFGQRFFGYSEEELVGCHVVGTIMPKTETGGRDMRALVDDFITHPAKYQENVNENITKNGRRVWVSWTNQAIYTEDALTGILAVGNDITELIRAEEALKQAHEELQDEIEERKVAEEELKVTTEELQQARNELERRVVERTQELLVTNEALLAEIEERERVEKTLLQRTTMLELANDAIIIRDVNDCITYWNRGAERLYGWKEEEVLGKVIHELFQTMSPEPLDVTTQALYRDGGWVGELTHRKRDGSPIIVASSQTVYYDTSGVPLATFEINYDVTERKQAEAKITRLNRLYTVLSKINEAMWRVREPKKLYEEACRIAVEDGLFRMAWIGKAEPDTHLVKPVAYWGFEEGYLDSITISVKDIPEGRGPTGTALREGRYVICNDYEHDPRLQIWRAEALKRGYRSSAAFPLKIGTRTIGALSLYADEQHFFDDEQILLLKQLADDVAFAIEFMEREEELMHRGEMLDLANEVIMIIDLDDTITYWNKGAERLYGWIREEAIGQMYTQVPTDRVSSILR